MLLALSLSAALWLQPAPEIVLAAPETKLVLSAATGPMLEFAYDVEWAEGRHWVAWRPPTRRVRTGEATAMLHPSAGQPLPSWNVRGRIGWVVDVPAGGKYMITISAPAADIDWRLEASARTEDTRLVLQPELVLANNAAEPLSVDRVVVLDKEGTCIAESEGKLAVEAGTRVRFAIGQPITLTGRTVHRFAAGRGDVSLIFLPDAPNALEVLTRLNFQSVTFFSARGTVWPVSLLLSPESGAEVNLGRSTTVWAKRTLLDERRTDLDFDKYGRVQGYDVVEEYQVEALSLAETPVELEIVEDLASTWELRVSPPAEKTEAGQAVIRLRLEPTNLVRISYTIVKHSGTRANR